MYVTSPRKWAFALAVDTVVFGVVALSVAELSISPIALAIAVWSNWVIALAGIAISLLLLLTPILGQARLDKLLDQEFDCLLNDEDPPTGLKTEIFALKDMMASVWSEKMVRALAYSRGFYAYHVATDLLLVFFFAGLDHPWLATFRLLSLGLSILVVETARRIYSENF